MKIKLGIIGFGGMGKWHSQNAPRAGVEIAAVCDINPERQQEAVDAGFKLYKTVDEYSAVKRPLIRTGGTARPQQGYRLSAL